MRKRALAYLARVGVQKLLGLLLYLTGAGWTITRAGGLYFACLFLATMVIGWLLLRAKADTDAPCGTSSS